MKTVLTLLLVATCAIYSPCQNTKGADQIGGSVSFGKNFVGVNVFMGKNKHRGYLGYTWHGGGGDNPLKIVSDTKSNYGTTVIGSGYNSTMIDFGYSKTFFDRLSVQPELSIGSRKFYTNYKDMRFNGGGYAIINRKELVAGVGVSVAYAVGKKAVYEPFLGVHTFKKLVFGVRFVWNQKFRQQ